MKNKVLIVVDPQVDFITGSMAVPDALQKMHSLRRHLENNPGEYKYIIITLDWHPVNHCSFDSEGGKWPPHCIAFTTGSLPFPDLYETILELQKNGTRVDIRLKGQDKDVEEYGAFDNYKDPWMWQQLLDADEIDITGIMSEYCVLESVYGIVDHYLELHKKINLKLPFISTMDNHEKLLEYANCEGIKYES